MVMFSRAQLLVSAAIIVLIEVVVTVMRVVAH
jgi:hypothetical protein